MSFFAFNFISSNVTGNSFTVLDITSTNSFSACNNAITVSSSGFEDVGISLDKPSAWLNIFMIRIPFCNYSSTKWFPIVATGLPYA